MPTLNVARPGAGPDGRPRAVIYAAIGLGWLSAVPAGLSLPPGAVVRRGRPPRHRARPPARTPSAGSAGRSPTPRSCGPSGSAATAPSRPSAWTAWTRLWSFRPIGGAAGAAAYGIFGVDRKQAFAEADRDMRRSLLLLALALLVALLADVARRAALRPATGGPRSSRPRAGCAPGEMGARTAMTGPGELDDLGRFFDRRGAEPGGPPAGARAPGGGRPPRATRRCGR